MHQGGTDKSKKAPRSLTAKTLYVFGVITLIIFHLEIFTGGAICKQIFGVGWVFLFLAEKRKFPYYWRYFSENTR